MSELEDRVQVLEEIVAGLHNITIPEPKYKKIIDLSKVVGSDIDCEFLRPDGSLIGINKLTNICGDGINETYESSGIYTTKCRIRQDHWHSWQGGSCPLPEGLEIELLFRGGKHEKLTDYIYDRWSDDDDNYDIIAFKVLCTAPGYKYKFE